MLPVLACMGIVVGGREQNLRLTCSTTFICSYLQYAGFCTCTTEALLKVLLNDQSAGECLYNYMCRFSEICTTQQNVARDLLVRNVPAVQHTRLGGLRGAVVAGFRCAACENSAT